MVAFVQIPLWTADTPHYSLCLVQAIFKSLGHEVKYFEFEIDFYHQCEISDKALWEFENGDFWDFIRKDTPKDLFERYSSFIDRYLDSIHEYDPDMICVSINHRSKYCTLRILKRLMRVLPNVLVIAGGPFCFDLEQSKELLETGLFDYICTGEAEHALPVLLGKLSTTNSVSGPIQGFIYRKDSEFVVGEEGSILLDLNQIPYADYSQINFAKYKEPNHLPLTMSRGCINRCKFCTESIYTRRFRYRSAENVLEEILCHIKNTGVQAPHYIMFNDSLINGSIRTLNALAELLIKSNVKINFGGMAVIRKEMDTSLLRKLRESGCYRIQYGVESGSDKIIRDIGKRYTRELASRVIQKTYEAGILVDVFIIVGYPGETERDFNETYNFLLENCNYLNAIYINTMMILKDSYIFRNHREYNIAEPSVVDWITADSTNKLSIRRERKAILEKEFARLC